MLELNDVIARCAAAKDLAVVKMDEGRARAPHWGCSATDRENLREGAVTPGSWRLGDRTSPGRRRRAASRPTYSGRPALPGRRAASWPPSLLLGPRHKTSPAHRLTRHELSTCRCAKAEPQLQFELQFTYIYPRP